MADDLAQFFWHSCATGELRYQRCGACGRVQFYPRPFCAACGGVPSWAVSRGYGTVYAATRVSRAPTPDFAALVPYDILLVDVDEGFRMMAHGAAGLVIGDRVRVGFRGHGERALAYFTRDGALSP
jgi:uncharacterized OB-fold protein